ncbi:MAG TPA: bifunctional diaminohydroxyphosphoribosylaminopyrimidine deaminase/5-amino-6-(5-phosphoribosylamino)uracil reductase RibD [Thermoleophilaceae bacterium]|nr:bifunctional diaminohydroxyphosphoribosylaminopyrimidine deaminase/5-amino-6-(5-phosphoribosylamino)uracil reductase RibD [Thermoleophilaceae bacterium]
MGPELATERDERHLTRAIELAEEARGRTSPNPLVGCVVVREGRVVGEGFHEGAGHPHAERVALAAAGEEARGATMYLTLEPCCHEGRTPPCTDAILEAGLARVVMASDDPTPKAAGRGPGILRDEGVSVELAGGEPAERARLINQPFRKHAKSGHPHVVFKSAMTLDGKVATGTGDSQWISGEYSRARAHRWRADSDAVAVGVGTALSDNPLLTARVEGVARQPLRAVFDSEGRLPLTSQLVRTAAEVPLVLVTSRAASRGQTSALEAAGAEVIRATGGTEPDRIRSALDELGARGIQSLLLEGGPHLAGAFLDAGEVDEIRLFVAPLVLGGRNARVPVEGRGVEAVDAARRALATEVERIGDDVLISSRLAEW